MDKIREKISKEAIVAEYLTGSIIYRGLEAKYGIPSRSICDWVMEYQGRKPSWKEKKRRTMEIACKMPDPELPKDVKLLQDALRKSQLKGELLAEMLFSIFYQIVVCWLENEKEENQLRPFQTIG